MLALASVSAQVHITEILGPPHQVQQELGNLVGQDVILEYKDIDDKTGACLLIYVLGLCLFLRVRTCLLGYMVDSKSTWRSYFASYSQMLFDD